MGRAVSPDKRGDNVFLTTPLGRAVAKGEPVQGFELRQIYNQLNVSTARPVIQDGVTIGALFVNHITDDGYVRRVRDMYLSPGTELVFYTKEAGVSGQSFTDEKDRELIRSYFTEGSDWVQDTLTDEVVSIADGRVYLVKNVTLPGVETINGGALLFVPQPKLSLNAIRLIVAVSVLLFLLFARLHHRYAKKEYHGWTYRLLVITGALIIIAVIIAVTYYKNRALIKLKPVPYPLYNSTLHLQPEAGIFDSEFEQPFAIVINTGNEPINAAEVSIQFDPELITVKSIDTENSACTYLIAKEIDMINGRVFLSCVLLDNPQNTRTITLGNLMVVPKQVGRFSLSFDLDKTKVLASDGLATNVLRYAQDGSYRVKDFSKKDDILTLYSVTHPNPARWYNVPDARFIWPHEEGVVYKYVLDSIPDTVPTDLFTTDTSVATVHIPGDGTFYFHVQKSRGGPVGHYKILSDITPPRIISMKSSANELLVGDIARLTFQAQDTTSGIQKNYYVNLGNHLFLPTGPELFIPLIEKGTQDVILRVYDSAGNYAEQTKSLIVK